MRTIKSRGLRVDTKEWVYGFVVKFNDDKQKNPLGVMIYVYEDNTYYEVIPESVGQFIGRVDKNKKEIYEGDIVDTRYGIRTVEWHDVSTGFAPFCDSSNAPDSETESEVIGNIHQDEEKKLVRKAITSRI